MEKLLAFLKTKRVQSAIVLVIVWLLGRFGIVVDETSTMTMVLELVQALASIWHIWGWVDAFPGHNGKGTLA